MGDNNDRYLMDRRETDWFRGMAAVMVVLSHYAEWWSWFTPMEGTAEVFRLALSKLGVYGVDIFFLLSGYAMVRSMKQERMYPQFIWKRIKNAYIPYFAVVGMMELLSGGFASMQDFWNFACGKDYWFMYVLFIFYIGFIAVYTVIGGKAPRCIAFCIFTYIFSNALYKSGKQDFWFVSNIAFAMGVVAAEYEEPLKKAVRKAGWPLAVVLMAVMALIARSGLDMNMPIGREKELLLQMEMGASAVWTVLVLLLVSMCRIKGKMLMFVGKNSLYIYLTHTYIFMWTVNALDTGFALRFAVSAILTLAVSALCGWLIAGEKRQLCVSGHISACRSLKRHVHCCGRFRG